MVTNILNIIINLNQGKIDIQIFKLIIIRFIIKSNLIIESKICKIIYKVKGFNMFLFKISK